MKIHGLQKLTLLDYPGRTACTVFLGGCDLRCPFCHNSELLDGSLPAELDEAALLAFLRKRRGVLDGVAFTGGEPLLRPELPELLRAVRGLGYAVKLDTNGMHPDALRGILDAGLADYIAMDVKNSPERYAETVGVAEPDLDAVRESIALLRAERADYEFRTTVVAELHDDESIRGIGEMIAGAKRWYLQPFVDRETVAYAGLHAPDAATLDRWLTLARGFVPAAAVRGV